MNRISWIVLLILVSATTVFAQSRVIRDSSGRVYQTEQDNGNQTTYRDSSGQYDGSSDRQGSQTIYRDSSGRITYTEEED